MLIDVIAFLAFFAGIGSLSALTVHVAVYFMVLCFLATGIVYYLLASTYLAMMLFIVYIGAIAMLFVFCIMLLDLTVRYYTDSYLSYSFIFFLLPVLFFFLPLWLSNFFIVVGDLNLVSDNLFFPELLLFSKDGLFLFGFYSFYSLYIIFLGVLLFFVTMAVTVLLGLIKFGYSFIF
jgi:NADH-quinone oxidoreductase subunit J